MPLIPPRDQCRLRSRLTQTPMPWYAAADATRDQTLYYVQNWRADVVALLNTDGRAVEHVRYTPYGSPRRLNMNPVDIAFDDGSALPPVGTATAGKVNNGVETGDYNLFLATFFDSLPAADVANDDGTPLPPFGPLGVNNGVTEGDYNLFFAKFYDGGVDEPGLSAPDVANTIGYAGYEHDPILLTTSALSADPNQSSAAYYHVRHRVYDTNLGRWTKRDPLGYVDGMGLYEYCGSNAAIRRDPRGTHAKVAIDGPSDTAEEDCRSACEYKYWPNQNDITTCSAGCSSMTPSRSILSCSDLCKMLCFSPYQKSAVYAYCRSVCFEGCQRSRRWESGSCNARNTSCNSACDTLYVECLDRYKYGRFGVTAVCGIAVGICAIPLGPAGGILVGGCSSLIVDATNVSDYLWGDCRGLQTSYKEHCDFKWGQCWGSNGPRQAPPYRERPPTRPDEQVPRF